MRQLKFKIRPSLILPAFCLLACTQMSETFHDSSAGVNGGFEITQDGLPVNWLMYTPNTVPNADFDIVLDTQDFAEGNQSLRYEVRECGNTGGWHSPGFTNEFSDVGRFRGPATYNVSYWIKNHNTHFVITGGHVATKTGDMRVLYEGTESIETWEQVVHTIEVPEDQWLRLQLNVLSPGSFWIDDVQINAN